MRQFTPTDEVDFVVIGSGAAGGIMAKQLSVAGFSVVVLEQGGWGKFGHEHDYTKDELLNRNPAPEDRLMSDPRGRQPNTFRRTANEVAERGGHNYGCVVGGGTVTYGGSSWRHLPWEFNEASHVGTIAGTGMADWPISYDELETRRRVARFSTELENLGMSCFPWHLKTSVCDWTGCTASTRTTRRVRTTRSISWCRGRTQRSTVVDYRPMEEASACVGATSSSLPHC